MQIEGPTLMLGLWSSRFWGKVTKYKGGFAIWLVEFSCATATKSLKEAVADPT